ncbi:MAG: hypothetical protein WCJ02_16835 [bacterium]
MEHSLIFKNLRKLNFVATNEELNALSTRWAGSSDLLINTTLDLLNALNVLPGITYRPRKDCGVSAYGVNKQGRERECFHISVLIRNPKLVIYQHGEAQDELNFFEYPQPSNPRIRRGYLSDEAIEKNKQLRSYIQKILRESYTILTSH